MKKLMYFVMAALMLSSCGMNTNSEDKAKADSLSNELSMKEKELDELLETINIVQEGFRQIDEAEGRLNLNSETENLVSEKDKIAEQMDFILNKMNSNREQIAKLEKMVKNNQVSSSKTKKTIELLTQQLKQKEEEIIAIKEELKAKNIKIAELDSMVNDMSTHISDLQAENESKVKVVDAQDKMINRAWYVFGTKKELKNHKIIDDGEVLQNENFDHEYFTEIDIRNFKELPLYSKRATIETTHPKDSYELVKDEKGQYILKIKNPEKFWNVSRYLVVLVK